MNEERPGNGIPQSIEQTGPHHRVSYWRKVEEVELREDGGLSVDLNCSYGEYSLAVSRDWGTIERAEGTPQACQLAAKIGSAKERWRECCRPPGMNSR